MMAGHMAANPVALDRNVQLAFPCSATLWLASLLPRVWDWDTAQPMCQFYDQADGFV